MANGRGDRMYQCRCAAWQISPGAGAWVCTGTRKNDAKSTAPSGVGRRRKAKVERANPNN
ncbi:hypothetical protein HaLaN_09329 [Haematococcus lacustris]|uniref:Uncharacterized protein n=1 Tax=Haematococcus lacustris TaxID=44745 RepID=A0A699ZD77_HAELA|nr:hypothetical protein HaLaN_09329 [Haematococcus lacustris]